MKLSKIFFGLATAAMFAACSSDELVQEQGQPQWDADGNGYMAFSVSMPQTPASRANDVFDDGLPEEFKVKDVILALFKGTTEANATCVSAYVVDQKDFGSVGNATDNVSSDRLIVQKITNPGASDTEKVFAFVILNNNGIFGVDASENLTIKGTAFSGNLAALQAKEYATLYTPSVLDNSASAFHTTGFMMANAPLYTKPGGTTSPFVAGDVQVLAPVDKNAIKSTKAEASATVAATVYVERAVAKVTMRKEGAGDGKSHTASAANMADFTWEANSWKLDNTNKKSFLVRNTADFGTWAALKSYGVANARFVGSKSVAHTGSSLGADGSIALYRTYFAKDPNYTGSLTPADEYNRAATAVGLSEDFGLKKPQYCAENTFDVDHQIWDHTTRVIVKTTLTSAGSYYGRPGDDGFLTEAAVKTLAYNRVLAALEGEADIAHLTGTATMASAVITTDADEITVKIGGMASDGTSEGDALIAQYATTGVKVHAADLGEGIKYYAKGVSYYQSRIKHFGDDLTPWNKAKDDPMQEWETGHQPKAGGVAEIYPDGSDSRQDANYLGRWGMLRNNWYDLNINSINKLGYPTPGELTYGTTTDDEIESWISVDVNILSWARREQNINF